MSRIDHADRPGARVDRRVHAAGHLDRSAVAARSVAFDRRPAAGRRAGASIVVVERLRARHQRFVDVECRHQPLRPPSSFEERRVAFEHRARAGVEHDDAFGASVRRRPGSAPRWSRTRQSARRSPQLARAAQARGHEHDVLEDDPPGVLEEAPLAGGEHAVDRLRPEDARGSGGRRRRRRVAGTRTRQSR